MKYQTLFIAVFVFVAGCNSSNNTEPMSTVDDTINADLSENIESSLVDRDWVLSSFTEVNGVETAHTNDTDFSFTLRFSISEDLDGRIRRTMSGNLVCNAYSGNYIIDNSILSTSNAELTTGTCERDGEAPSVLFGSLLLVREEQIILTVQNNRLELLSGSNERLVFTDISE